MCPLTPKHKESTLTEMPGTSASVRVLGFDSATSSGITYSGKQWTKHPMSLRGGLSSMVPTGLSDRTPGMI